ncbi:SulP family inorganic anion transporter [Tessaracoccus oleiagri]|uniref:Sulfate permease, SulP family n=1 Tax=Tessaracoccus oleiagri TaxID=686624 RepID=A0A1G9HD93_9ACTN|nr:SulP family inorganic anion transporter [Tessaracoccus oleiagri]SDL10796.1 sulfate permease, SulP family [Tessaracoccus oleiagri]
MRSPDVRVLTLLPSPADYAELPRSWPKDLLAGVTVGIVALPLALAFAISSGAAPEAGLVTAIVAGFVAAVFGGSHVQVSGPTGAMVVVLAPIAALHGPAALPLVAIMAGIIVVVGGVLRFGRAVSFIPWPVIEGFTLGIGVIIFLQQVPTALGTVPGESRNAFVAAVQSLGTVEWPGVAWALGSVAVVVAIMMLTPRIHPQIPGSIIAIIVVTTVVELTGAPVARIGELPESLPAPALPGFDLALLQSLVVPAFTVAALAAIESLLSARVASGISDTGRYDGDRELVGQGLASVASGLFGGMPATGAIARTAVNIRAGARTRAAAVVHALFLAGVVYFLADAVSRIPLVALAGVLIVTAINMIDVETAKDVIGASRSDALIFTLTALVTVSFDLIIAVGIGIAATAFFALRALSRMSRVEREPLPVEPLPGDERIALLRLDGAMFFGVGDRILARLEDMNKDVRVVIIRMSQLQFMDSSGARVLAELVTTLERRGITVLVKGIQSRHQRLAMHGGVVASLRHRNHLFTAMSDAIAHARSHVARETADIT